MAPIEASVIKYSIPNAIIPQNDDEPHPALAGCRSPAVRTVLFGPAGRLIRP